MSSGTVVHIDRVEPFSPPGGGGVYLSRMLLDKHNSGSERLQVNHGQLKAGCALPGAVHPPPHDEVYVVLKGEALLRLDGVPHEIRAGAVVFISAGTSHALTNTSQTEDLELITVWPGPPAPGANEVYDMRLHEWGTTYREVPAPAASPPESGRQGVSSEGAG